MRVEGLEPTRREALDPKSSMSTNFITPAYVIVDLGQNNFDLNL